MEADGFEGAAWRTDSSAADGDLLAQIVELRRLYQESASRAGALGSTSRIEVWTKDNSGEYRRFRRRWAFGPLVRRFVESHIAVSIDRLDKGVRLQFLGGPDQSDALAELEDMRELREAVKAWPRSIPLLNILSLLVAIAPLVLGLGSDTARSGLILLAAASVAFLTVVALNGYRPRRAILGGGWGLTFKGNLASRAQYDYWDFDGSAPEPLVAPKANEVSEMLSAREHHVFGALPVRRPSEFPFDLYLAILVGFYIFGALLIAIGDNIFSGAFTFGDGVLVLGLVFWTLIFYVGMRGIIRAWREWRRGQALS